MKMVIRWRMYLTFLLKNRIYLRNDDIYNHFSRNALERFKKDLTVDKMTVEYLKIYKAGTLH